MCVPASAPPVPQACVCLRLTAHGTALAPGLSTTQALARLCRSGKPMVLFLLCIKADLEGVASVSLPEARYCLTVKNSAGEDVREGVYVSADEVHELSGSRGTANFRLKWVRDAKHEAYLNLQEVKGVTRALTDEDEHKFVPIVAFECRGLEPIDWRPEAGFLVKGKSGQVWEDVDLSEREWVDYDEKSGASVSIMGPEWEFRVHK